MFLKKCIESRKLKFSREHENQQANKFVRGRMQRDPANGATDAWNRIKLFFPANLNCTWNSVEPGITMKRKLGAIKRMAATKGWWLIKERTCNCKMNWKN